MTNFNTTIRHLLPCQNLPVFFNPNTFVSTVMLIIKQSEAL